MPTALQAGNRRAGAVQGRSMLAAIGGERARRLDAISMLETFFAIAFQRREFASVETENYQFIEASRPRALRLAADRKRREILYADKESGGRELAIAYEGNGAPIQCRSEWAEKTGSSALMERLKSLGYAGILWRR